MSASICVYSAAPFALLKLFWDVPHGRDRHTHTTTSLLPWEILFGSIQLSLSFFKFREREPLRWVGEHKLGLMIPYFLLLSRALSFVV